MKQDELDPINLFNITWKDATNQVRKVVLPPALTGIDANVVVMLGCGFPSGSHKVGPAYSTLIEGLVDGEIVPGEHTILGPSTGNFGIGTAYISRLLGFRAIVIMPDNMSKERYERIRKYGGELELTPGSESDVILTLEKTRELMKNPKNKALAQFELFPNYRFHRHVTGGSAIEAVKASATGASRASPPRRVQRARSPPATRSRPHFLKPRSPRSSLMSAPRWPTAAAASIASKASATRCAR